MKRKEKWEYALKGWEKELENEDEKAWKKRLKTLKNQREKAHVKEGERNTNRLVGWK